MIMRRYQVATTSDCSMPLRKWHHLGTVWAFSARCAAGMVSDSMPVRYANPVDEISAVFECADGTFVRVSH